MRYLCSGPFEMGAGVARLPRYALPGQAQHLIQRGNNRQAIFFTDEDYALFLECVSDAAARHGCGVHAYVLMTNHVHLLLTPERPDSLSKLMQSVGRRYVQHVNYHYRRTGTLWEGRFKATPIDTERYLMLCYRYIELNPVRAGMVSHPGHYRWSSYHANADGEADGLVVPHGAYLELGRDEVARREAYQALFSVDLDDETLAQLRQTVNKGWALGNDRFKSEIEVAGQRQAQPKSRGGARKKKREGVATTEIESASRSGDLFNRV